MYNRALLFALLAILLSIAQAAASPINVTNSALVTLQTNESLIFYISSDYSYPGEIQILLGGMPLDGPVVSIPGTSGVYISGILFSGTLESQDGSVSIPLTDPDAASLDLPAGDMLLTPGSRSGGSYSGTIDLLSAAVALSPQEAAALFASGEAVIDFRNTGAPITFGYSGVPIGSDFSASLLSPGGAQSVGARVMQVDCANADAPEPGTIGLLLIGLGIIATRLAKR